MPRERVLIVDEQPTVVRRCANVLEAHDYGVLGAESGKQALELARAGDVDVLLVSMNLSDLSGQEVFRLARQAHPELVAVALAGKGALRAIIEAFEVGFAEFVPKPINDLRLVEALEHALNERRLRDEVARLKALHSVYEASRTILMQNNRDDLCELVLQIGLRETGSDSGSLMLLDHASDELRLVASAGLNHAAEAMIRKLGEPVAGTVAQRGEMVVTRGDVPSLEMLRPHLTRPQVRASLCSPLAVADRVLGVLNLNKARPGSSFSEGDMELVAVLCGEGALALARIVADEEQARNQRVLVAGAMVGKIIHDFRSPLTAIRGMVGLVEREFPTAREHCDFMVRELSRIMEMMEGVLTYTRGTKGLALEATAVGALLREVAETARRDFDGRHPVVEDVEFTGAAQLDRRQLRRALVHLIRNGRNAMQRGQVLTLRSRAEGDHCLRLEVQDEGCGMDQATLAGLFQPFYAEGRLHGTGLGLCIVKSVIEAHSGTVQVASEVGQGTTVSLRLPLNGG